MIKHDFQDKPSLPCFKIYQICKGEDSNNQKEIVSLKQILKYDLPSEFFEDNPNFNHQELLDVIRSCPGNKHVLHVDNKGHFLYIFPDKNIFIINRKNIWNQFKDYLDKDKLGTWDDLDALKFGQGYIIIQVKDILYHMTYDGSKNRLTSGKVLKHKALNIPDECDLKYIVPTSTSQYVNLFYSFGTSMCIVVWDLYNDNEYSSFTSRQDDHFVDFFMGQNTKLGFVSFEEYIVNLDDCIPNPYMSKKDFISEKS